MAQSKLINLAQPMSMGQFKSAVGASKLTSGRYTNPITKKEVKALLADGVSVAFIASTCDLSKPVQVSLVKSDEEGAVPFYLASNPLEMESLGFEF